MLRCVKYSAIFCVFIHGHSPCLHAEVASVSARRRGLMRRRIKIP
jgi:hypothetical protein